MQLNLNDLMSQARDNPMLSRVLSGTQAMMAGAACASNAKAQYTVLADPRAACDEMTRLFKEGHIPMGAPVFDGGRWVVFYWEKDHSE